jgi:deoxyribodipyrimidine photo-lyase
MYRICFDKLLAAWPPERKIFGGVRYMSSENTDRKFHLKPYHAYVERLPTISAARSDRLPGGL